MSRSIIAGIVIAMLFLSGCTKMPSALRGDWSQKQKSEFIRILESDKYSSICGLDPLYNQYKSTKDSTILTELLVRYTKNLSDGCIDISSFRASQEAKKSKKIETHYALYLEKADRDMIISQLQSGLSIDAILEPYVPKTPQFERLIKHYNALKANEGVTSEKARKVKLNIERTKLMSSTGWDTYVLINVPQYQFRFFESGTKRMEFGVVVGKYTWQTPIFDSTLKYIVVNPTWNVPDNIARQEIIPHYLRNRNYLKRKNMVVRRDYNIDSEPVNPGSVNWSKYLTAEYKTKSIPYKFIERSSAGNALGRVKFMFPNRFSVYMHDTNNKKLFNYNTPAKRFQSHGCIRLAQPKDLLRLFGETYTAIPYSEVVEKYNSKKMYHINLNQDIRVHVTYLTAYVEENGTLHFFGDQYGYDKSQKLEPRIR